MKTLGEFLQRLEDDSAFEKKAQAFNNGDELMAFVKSEGYDFTLEQLTSAFKQRANLPPQAESTGAGAPGRQRLHSAEAGGHGVSRESGSLPPRRDQCGLTKKSEPPIFPGSSRGRSYRNYRGQCPRRTWRKSQREGCLGVAGADTGGFPPRD